MALVDVVLGPLLTLIIFKPKKKGLIFDLVGIATLQVAAFIYGAFIVWSERPIVLAFAGDHFVSVTHAMLPPDYIKSGALETLSGSKPKKVIVLIDKDVKASEIITRYGSPAVAFPYYKDYGANFEHALRSAKAVDDQQLGSEETRQALKDMLSKEQINPDDIVISRYVGRFATRFMIINKGTGDIQITNVEAPTFQ